MTVQWSDLSAIVSAGAALLAAGAAYWSAALAASSNRQAEQVRRTALEREADRAHVAVPATASRVRSLAEQLQREYTTLFALAGRDVAGAEPLRARAALKHQGAERVLTHVEGWLVGYVPLAIRTDQELEHLVREADGLILQLERLEVPIASELRSVEEQIRPLRERAIRAQKSRGAS